MASCKILSTKSTRSQVAFVPISPIRKTCSAVGPKPPLISNLYLKIVKVIKINSDFSYLGVPHSLSHRVLRHFLPLHTRWHLDGVYGGQTIIGFRYKHFQPDLLHTTLQPM